MWIERVPTEVNVADDPSRRVASRTRWHIALYSVSCAREDYALLTRLGASRVEAKLDDVFLAPKAWESLSMAGSSA